VDNPVLYLQIDTASPLPATSNGENYSLTFAASNGTGPYYWTVTSGSLPAGLSLGSDGVLSGTPAVSETGTWPFSVRVTDANYNTADKDFTLSVATVPPPPVDADGDGLTDLLEAELSAETGIAIHDGSQFSNPYGYHDWWIYYFARLHSTDVDSDGDGVGAWAEAALGTSDQNPDSNGDFRPDGWEFYHAYHAFTAAAGVDGDEDGLPAQLEAFLGTCDDPDSNIANWQDFDGDGLSDYTECVSASYSSPALADTDGDGLYDGAEAAAGTNPRNVDTDGDYLNDNEEVNVFVTVDLVRIYNPLVKDTDGDGKPDYYEAFEAGLLVDTDGAGIPDRLENYWGLSPNNPYDENGDIDSDGLTNLQEYNSGYDIWNGFTVAYDTDGDGMTNVWEMDNGTNPDVADGDQDPDNDWWLNIEEFRNQTPANDWNHTPPPEDVSNLNRWNADWDGDGKSNYDEVYGVVNSSGIRVYSNPRLSPLPPLDSDGDGYSDAAELAAGTDPFDPASHPGTGGGGVAAVVAHGQTVTVSIGQSVSINLRAC
jgi:hypothetical protein